MPEVVCQLEGRLDGYQRDYNPARPTDHSSQEALYDVLPPKRARAMLSALTFVYTPKLNVAEIKLSVRTHQGLTARVASLEEFA